MITLGGTAKMDVRYSFTAQYLCASAIFARHAARIEAEHFSMPDNSIQTEHRGYVTAAIMQSTAALEAESAEIMAYGPGHHLGSDKTDHGALSFLAPLADMVDEEQALDRFWMILHLLRKEPLDKGRQPWQDASLLVKLRNELVHYKSKLGEQMSQQKLFASLVKLGHLKPAFVQGNVNFFPHECLSAACAAWAVRTGVAFLNAFYDRLGLSSPLAPCATVFSGL